MALQLPDFDIVDSFANDFQVTANDYAQAARNHATAAATHTSAAENHAHHVATFVPELKKYRDVAAPDLQALMDRLDRMDRDSQNRMDEMARDNRRDFDALNQRFDTLGTKMQAAYVISESMSPKNTWTDFYQKLQ